MSVDLLSCPFCGSDDVQSGGIWGVHCKTCGALGPDLSSSDEQVTWDTRAPDPAVAVLEAEVARLRAQYEDEHQARLSLQSLAADEIDVSIALLRLLSEVRIYVTDALEAYEHTDGRDLLNGIDAALNPPSSEKEAG